VNRILAGVVIAALLCAAPASAQNLSLRGPAWAQAMLSADVTPTTGGRAALNEPGVVFAARVTIAPTQGGVGRVIRFEDRADGATLALRRFTGHANAGWWMWGPDTPLVTTPTRAQREEVLNLVRSALGMSANVGVPPDGSCTSGEQAFVELALDGRSTSVTRACLANTDAVGRLATRLSELAGSRTEEELHVAAAAELMAVDAAFSAKAAADGVPAAFTEFAAEDAIMFNGDAVITDRAGVTALMAAWPEGARMTWTPETARVSERGDMGWTWGNAIRTAPDGTRTTSRYVSVWKRDWEGKWRFALDAGIR
jgi:ketosteroid isomerase-like protein